MPDKVIFLDMPPEWGIKLMAQRANKITGEAQKDIHESNSNHLYESYDNAVYAAQKFGWERIVCVKDDTVRSVEDIHNEIYSKIQGLLK